MSPLSSNRTDHAAASEKRLFDAVMPPLPQITTRTRQPDPVLAAMHRQVEPWTPSQWAYAEQMEADHA